MAQYAHLRILSSCWHSQSTIDKLNPHASENLKPAAVTFETKQLTSTFSSFHNNIFNKGLGKITKLNLFQYEVFSTTQWMHMVQSMIAASLDIQKNKVDVKVSWLYARSNSQELKGIYHIFPNSVKVNSVFRDEYTLVENLL